MGKSFAAPSTAARRAVTRAHKISQARHGAERTTGAVHSIGTARQYEAALTRAAEWDRVNGGRGIASWDADRARAYLSERAEGVQQKTLDQDRQALQVLPHVGTLERVRSEVDRPGLADQGRAYSAAQVRAISAAQTARNAISTEVAHAAGLRAHELHTIRPAAERPPSGHREWSPDRFKGLSDTARYTVTGKGGLTREVALPRALADRLESRRLDQPRTVTDRGIHYRSQYDIGGGQSWSSSFGRASDRVLGYSTGAHGVRHSYAQERVSALQSAGASYRDALATVSEEMGHFRAEITEVYLR